MEISKILDGGRLSLALAGRLDTVTAPQLQMELDASLGGVTELAFDFAALEYISSAGLRVMLSAHKKMASAGGTMSIAGANAMVREVFDMTGFSDILTLL